MESKIDLSIVIPFYKGDLYIIDLLHSLVNSHQISKSLVVVEIIIIIDSVSTNLKDVKETSNRLINDLFVLRVLKNQFNYGVARTRNIGINAAKGNSLLLIDQDDIVAPNFFEKITKDILFHSEFILCNGHYSYSNKYKVRMYFFEPYINLKNLILDDFIRSPGQVILKKKLLGEHIRFPIPLHHFGSDDKFFYILLFFLKNPQVAYISDPLYVAVIHNRNYSHDEQESLRSTLELWSIVTKQYPELHFNRFVIQNIKMLKYRLHLVNGLDRMLGFIYFVKYKVKANKLLRYFLKSMRYRLR